MKKALSFLIALCLLLGAAALADDIRAVESITLTDEDTQQLPRRICITKADANLNPMVLVDFEAGMAYYDEFDFLDDPSAAAYRLVLDETLLETVTDMTARLHLCDWQPLWDFPDSEQDHTERSYWEANFEYDRGVARFIQIGMPENDLDGKPYEADLFTMQLMRLVWENGDFIE